MCVNVCGLRLLFCVRPCCAVLFGALHSPDTDTRSRCRRRAKQAKAMKKKHIHPTHTHHTPTLWWLLIHAKKPPYANHPPLHSVPLALGSTEHYSTMGAAVPLSSFLLSAAPPVRRRSTCELSNRSTFAYCASSVEAFEAFYVVVMFLLLLYTFCQLSPGQASVLGGR